MFTIAYAELAGLGVNVQGSPVSASISLRRAGIKETPSFTRVLGI